MQPQRSALAAPLISFSQPHGFCITIYIYTLMVSFKHSFLPYPIEHQIHAGDLDTQGHLAPIRPATVARAAKPVATDATTSMI
ncbi:MAG: hypothetical protein ABFS02_11905 [Pseudomonadota bacterium]